ncbi:hypothetical protein AMECASPLE_036823 [Ameca splendens]|uniref:Uncharacterized protein n=1 Tax=Ameca splendens TaxID=208324 RepID=A0ABV0Y7L4_9TELE
MDPSPAQQWRACVDNSIARLDSGMSGIITMLRSMSPVSTQAPLQPAPPSPPAVPVMVKEPRLVYSRGIPTSVGLSLLNVRYILNYSRPLSPLSALKWRLSSPF